jgi:hypothetical protein
MRINKEASLQDAIIKDGDVTDEHIYSLFPRYHVDQQISSDDAHP